jgi:hypothetical protein
VVLEAQYQSSISAAVNQINSQNKDLCIEVLGLPHEYLSLSDDPCWGCLQGVPLH